MTFEIRVGETLVPAGNIQTVDDSEIHFDVPELDVSLQSAALAVGVTRDGVEGLLIGAMVIQPRVTVQDIDPVIGPPEGGNRVDLYGVGFSNDIIVRFNDVIAGDLKLLSSSHVRVRAPAGSFGFADVAVESRLFPDEASILAAGYFYGS